MMEGLPLMKHIKRLNAVEPVGPKSQGIASSFQSPTAA